MILSELVINKDYANKDKFGIYIKWRRMQLGLTVRDFAEKLNLSVGYMCDIENGKRTAPIKCISQMIQLLNIENNERNYFYDLVGSTHSNWSDINEYLQQMPNAREFLRLAQTKNLSDEEISSIILSLDKSEKEILKHFI